MPPPPVDEIQGPVSMSHSRRAFLPALLLAAWAASATAATLEPGRADAPIADLAKVSVGVASAQLFTVNCAAGGGLAQRSADARTFAAWLFQLLASSTWVVSVIIYDSYDTGDMFQLLAALCWTLSNVVAMPEAILPLLACQPP